ncbi:MAG: rhodanese-related sulfurtransferase [Acidobacteriaceae bacterium]|nr:rhodanese-related sulfurtransferase [Acidobacteriaceae bacterium]
MNPFVTPEWLAARIDDPNTVILDATLPPVGVTPPVDTRARYLAQHLPGAVFFDIDALSDHASPYPHMLPTPEAFAQSMSTLGISDTSTIVIYEQQGVFSAPRARWMLRTFGAENVYLLDGDLQAWTAAGLPIGSGPVERTPATFPAKLDPSAVQSLPQLKQSIANHQQILDARSAGRFTGTAPEPRAGLSSGHMPGATSVPFTELVENGHLKTAAEIRDLFAAKHVDLQQPITTTCGSGVTAAVIALGLEIAGATQISLYDGSWAEYAQQADSIIEK